MVVAYQQGLVSVSGSSSMASLWLCFLSPSIQFSFPDLALFSYSSAIGSKQFYSLMVITAYRRKSHIPLWLEERIKRQLTLVTITTVFYWLTPSSCCCSKVSQTGWFNQQNFISHSLEGCESKIELTAHVVSGRGLQFAIFLLERTQALMSLVHSVFDLV